MPTLGKVARASNVHAPTRMFSSIQFVETHEWMKLDGSTATVGISDHAQAALGDVVYCDLPDIGDTFDAGESFGSVESVKASSDVYTPIAGEVVEINESLNDTPETVNESPQDDGWFIKLKVASDAETTDLMDEEAYQTFLDSQ